MLSLVLPWLKAKAKSWFGLTNLTGPATMLAGLLVLFGAGINWFRDDAIRDTNAQWELRLQKEQARLRDNLVQREAKIRELEEKLREEQERVETATFANNQLLEKQREKIPLSEACNACRIPNERLWVRPATRASSGDQSRPGS